jgi:probable rRNA maturation factor
LEKSQDNSNLDILNKTKGTLPNVPFDDMKNAVLGKKYELSLVFIGSKRSRKLNRELRGKDKAANILSFPFDEKSGEIFIDLNHAYKQAPQFEREKTNFIGFLFIHGLLHLKGFDHGDTMESKEKKIRNTFHI